MLNEYEEHFREVFGRVYQEAETREDYDDADPLARSLTHIRFIDEVLDFEGMQLLSHLLRTRSSDIRFYPWSWQRFCAVLKKKESPHFVISDASLNADPSLPRIQIWKRNSEGALYVPAISDEVTHLYRLGYHQGLINYFGSRTLIELTDNFRDQVIGVINRKNRYSQSASRTA